MQEKNTKSIEEVAAEMVDKMDTSATTTPTLQDGAVETLAESSYAVRERRTDIAIRDGKLVPANLTEATRVARGLLAAGCLPKQLDSEPKVLMAMQFLRQLGLPDIACLPRVCIINGSYSLWGEGPKALCQPEIEDFHEFWFDKDYSEICFANKNLSADAYGSLCRVKRRGLATWVERAFTMDDARKAGLANKSGPWTHYPRRMLQMRTRAWALKDAFPDRLMGLAIAEYDHHTTLENGEVVAEDQAGKLVQRFQ